jgi:hypothetical protein
VATYASSDSSESLHISGRELYHAQYSTDGCGRLGGAVVRILRSEAEFHQVSVLFNLHLGRKVFRQIFILEIWNRLMV